MRLTRSVRERPRIAAARVLAVVLLVGVGVAVGGLADRGSEPAGDRRLQPRLERSERARHEAVDALHALRVDLRRAERRSTRLARANARLRHELRRQRRSAQRPRRKR